MAATPPPGGPQHRAPDPRCACLLSHAFWLALLEILDLFFFFFLVLSLIWLIGVADVQREEKNVQKSIKEAAKRNDMASAKVRSTPIYTFRSFVVVFSDPFEELFAGYIDVWESACI